MSHQRDRDQRQHDDYDDALFALGKSENLGQAFHLFA